MSNKHFLSIFFSLTLLLTACGSNSNFTQQEKEFIHNLFLTEYLWYDQVASNVEYAAYATPQSMINDLRVDPPDVWSYSITQDQYEDYVNQKTAGFGFGYTPNLQIFLVRIDAPAYGKLLRGDRIIEVNGEEASASLIREASSNLGSPTTFTVLRGSNILDISVTPNEYTFKVTLGKVIPQGDKEVGYLRYDSFTSTSVEEFETEFTKFKNANIDELIIDLRYNGGGSVAVASTLIDNITNAYPGQRQGYLDWNDNYKHKNESFSFSDEIEPNDLNMTRVIFLVTKNSASASELVISALKPYLGHTNIITIGSATHGKNVGMSGRVYGENYYFLINFYVRNNAGETTSFDGIPATCSAKDDLTHLMGNEDEEMLNTALYYIANNVCP